MQRRLRHSLVMMTLGVLFLPMLQRLLSLVEERQLNGIQTNAPAPEFTVGGWLDGSLQEAVNKHARQAVGFHHSLVRLNNQWFFTLYRNARANSVLIGKDNCLYDQTHIDSYLGKDFIGDKAITTKMQRLSDLRSMLLKKGIQVYLVITPGKGMCMPDHLPPSDTIRRAHTNYESFRRVADSLQFPFLDLAAWYNQTKDKSRFPMYATGGNHWSEYCGTLAADTLLGYLESKLNTDLNRFEVSKVHENVPASPIDNDINLGMNLLLPIEPPKMAYPEVAWQGKPRKLKVLTIGDSFYFKFFTDFSSDAFESTHFWFYFRELQLGGRSETYTNDKVDLRLEIDSQDVVLIYVADPHLTNLGFGFVEQALMAYHDPAWRQKEIQRISADIQKDAAWMAKIAEKAALEGIPMDQMLQRDAIWVLENSRLKP